MAGPECTCGSLHKCFGTFTVIKTSIAAVTMKVGDEVVSVSADKFALEPPLGTNYIVDFKPTTTNVSKAPQCERASTHTAQKSRRGDVFLENVLKTQKSLKICDECELVSRTATCDIPRGTL